MFSPMSIEPQLCADDKMSCWAKLSMAHRISTKCWMIEKLVERKYLKTGKQQFVLSFRLWWGNRWKESNQCYWFSLSNIKYTLHLVTLCLSLKAHGGKPIQTQTFNSFIRLNPRNQRYDNFLSNTGVLLRPIFICMCRCVPLPSSWFSWISLKWKITYFKNKWRPRYYDEKGSSGKWR